MQTCGHHARSTGAARGASRGGRPRLLFWLAGSVPLRAESPPLVTLGAGGWDILRDDRTAVAAIEYMTSPWLAALRPQAGVLGTAKGAFYVYAGLALDIPLGECFVLQPSAGPGLYHRGGGTDLGHVVEFRTSLRLAARLRNESRFGVEIQHLSNAGLGSRNPGAEQVFLFYAIPFHSAR